MLISDFAAAWYLIVAVGALYESWRYYCTPDGLARKFLIADKLALCLFMLALLAAYITRRLGMSEAAMEIPRAITRWLVVLYGLILVPRLWIMRRRKRKE